MWDERKTGFVAALLATAALFAPSHPLCAPETKIELSIGDTADRIRRDVPRLAPYLAEIEKEARGADQMAQEFAKAAEECERENARLKAQRKELRDCDEVLPIDPVMIDEPGLIIDATLAYRGGKVAFEVPGAWHLRFRGGFEGGPLREIRVDLRPVFRDVPNLLQRFDELSASAERLLAALERSGLRKFRDDDSNNFRRPNDRIFTLRALQRDLAQTQRTEQDQIRCGGKGHYLLGAWSNEEILALLELTAEGHPSGVVAGGGEGGDERGYRLAVIVADNRWWEDDSVPSMTRSTPTRSTSIACPRKTGIVRAVTRSDTPFRATGAGARPL